MNKKQKIELFKGKVFEVTNLSTAKSIDKFLKEHQLINESFYASPPENWVTKEDNWTYFYMGFTRNGSINSFSIENIKRNKYEIITVEQAEKIINGEGYLKEIIGYKADKDYYNGNVKKGSVLKKNYDNRGEFVYDSNEEDFNSECFYFPIEIVQTWEPVYEEDQLPKIGNFKGKIDRDKMTITYGCKTVKFDFVKSLYKKLTVLDSEGIQMKEAYISRNILKKIIQIINNK